MPVPSDGDLPKRHPGASPMAAAGAKAGESAAAGAQYTIKRLGPRPPRPSRRSVVIAAAVVLVAVAGAALAVAGVGQTGSRGGRPGAMPTQAPPRHSAVPVPVKPASPAPSARERRRAPVADVVDVAGVGCPGNGTDAVIPDNAPTGPGWALAGGGWTGNGCDGTTLWTMDPNGNQPVPSVLTWRFVPSPGTTRCTLAVFIPTQNALGVSDYSVSAGTDVVDAVLIRQGAESGRWLTLGTFTVSGGALEIMTAPVPAASGRGHHSAIAASAASASCT